MTVVGLFAYFARLSSICYHTVPMKAEWFLSVQILVDETEGYLF